MRTSARAATPGSRAQVVVLIALIVTVAFYLASFLLHASAALPIWVVATLATLPFLFASVLAWQRFRSLAGEMAGWRWVALALVAYGLGQGSWYVLDALGRLGDPPAVPDVFYLAFSPLAFAGLLALAHRRLRRSRERGWLDALVVGSGAFTLGAAYIADHIDQRVTEVTPALLVSGAYLLSDLVLLALVVAVAQGFGWRAPLAWWALIAGLVVLAVADGMYVISVSTGAYVDGTFADSGWVVGGAAIGIAAWLDRPVERVATISAWSTRIGPAAAILGATAVLALSTAGGVHWFSRGAACVTIILGVLRMAVSVGDADDFAERLRRAELDPLTGLLNQRGLQALPAARTAGGALILLDLDGFTDVNHALGREAGDLVLIEVAQRLRDEVRATDLVARVGGDDFGIVLLGSDASEAVRVAESLVRELERPIPVLATSVHVSASVGVTPIHAETKTLNDALRDAGEALGQARAQGVGVVQLFAGSNGERSVERLQLRAELRAAMADGGSSFVLHYQPIVDVVDGDVLAVEALVRWQRAGRLLGPGEFLAEVEHAGAMGTLTTIVLNRALTELRSADLPFPVTVNVPPTLIGSGLVERVASALEASGSRPEQLLVEVLEDALIRDPHASRTVLEALRARGVRVLLDDFGTGWSGFGTLRDLAVDGLKIDGSFVSEMHADPTASAIVGAVAGVARDLDLIVVYEGAESPETLEALRTMAEAYGQGYGLARPMPVADLARWAALRVGATVVQAPSVMK